MRKDRDWSQTKAFEELRDGLHFGPKSRSAYIALDMGRRVPTTDEQKFLVSYFGKSPDDIPEPPAPADPTGELASALLALTAELTAMRQERETQEERLRALEAAIALTPPDDQGLRGRSVPRETAR